MDIRKFPSALTKGVLAFAGLMTVAALSVHLSSYGPDQIGPTLMNFALALFPIVFLVFGPVVVIVAFARMGDQTHAVRQAAHRCCGRQT
jgi:hypothetical protein